MSRTDLKTPPANPHKHDHGLTATDAALAGKAPLVHAHPDITARLDAIEKDAAVTKALLLAVIGDGTFHPPAPPDPPAGYDAYYVGTADDSTALPTWIALHAGETMHVQSARIFGVANSPALRLFNRWDITFDDLRVVGTGWDGTYYPTRQWEAGVLIEGGGRLTFNDPQIRNTKGDGFDIDVATEAQDAPVDIVITNPMLYQTARNGITLNAGQASVTGGTIDKSGLHNIDMEPNHDAAAGSIDGTFTGIRLTNHGVLYVHDNEGDPDITGYAIAGLGYSDARKIAIRIVDCSSDKFWIVIDAATTCVFTGNSSDVYVTGCGAPAVDPVFLSDMTNKTVSGNTNMCVNTTYDVRS